MEAENLMYILPCPCQVLHSVASHCTSHPSKYGKKIKLGIKNNIKAWITHSDLPTLKFINIHAHGE